jgi:hypothetical protein
MREHGRAAHVALWTAAPSRTTRTYTSPGWPTVSCSKTARWPRDGGSVLICTYMKESYARHSKEDSSVIRLQLFLAPIKRNNKQYKILKKMKITTRSSFIFNLQIVDSALPLLLLPKSVWRCWLRTRSHERIKKTTDVYARVCSCRQCWTFKYRSL